MKASRKAAILDRSAKVLLVISVAIVVSAYIWGGFTSGEWIVGIPFPVVAGVVLLSFWWLDRGY